MAWAATFNAAAYTSTCPSCRISTDWWRERAADGTVLSRIITANNPSRQSDHNVFREVSGSTGCLFTNESMMQQEARFVLQDDNWTNWKHSLQNLMREEHMVPIPFMFLNCDLANGFVNNCVICYKPTDNITIDEELFSSSCRCPFTQYMSNKPDMFGVKYWLAVDAKHQNILNGFPYLGKDATRPADRHLGEHVVLRLTELFFDKGINVTTDSYFTSGSLVNELKKRKTSLVGTLNRARREVQSSVNDMVLTSYQGKVTKNVLVLNTIHTGVDIDQQTVKKVPETIKFYNGTTYGGDVVDQMARKYTMRAMGYRWPVNVFYNILDLACINAHKEEHEKK
ncbi:hypothetical protein PR048_014078, partial [Dryococelus australis]